MSTSIDRCKRRLKIDHEKGNQEGKIFLILWLKFIKSTVARNKEFYNDVLTKYQIVN